MSLSRNLSAGIANSGYSGLLNLAVVPFYINYLGVEAYGLIGFYIVTQSMLSILDMGMAATINREVARHSATGSLFEAGKLLHTLARIYWIVAGIIALLFLTVAPWFSGYWLQPGQLSAETISHAVMLLGVVISCRWPIGLYQGALIGAKRLTVSSGINMVMVTFGCLGGIAVLRFISPTIEAFFIWQACVGLAHAVIVRAAAWRVIDKPDSKRFDLEKLRGIWKFTAGMSGIGLTSIVITQLDKVMLSKLLGLEQFGQYMLAVAVVGGLYVLVSPVYNVIYPRMSELVATGDSEKLAELYRNGTRMLVTLLFPLAMILAVFSSEVLYLWTGNPELAKSVAPILSFLVVGSAFHGVMYFPYALQLAYGKTSLPLITNIILTVILVPLLYWLVSHYGAIGGAVAWLLLHMFYLFFGSWLTHKFFLKGLASKWLFIDVGVPLLIFLLAGLVGHYVILAISAPAVIKLLAGTLLAGVASMLIVVLSPAVSSIILGKLNTQKIYVR